ncbi:hypothetical protein LIER_05899 [Lithospermum erythrorhizon]|uniref:Uncharacterized protein n=1 Tax=Lithospermum erythrorhizon TaxID=34254 RepID=A0AAV3P3U8_LITER
MYKSIHMANQGNMKMAMVAPQIAIVSPLFCVSYPVELNVVRKMVTLRDSNFAVVDVNGNVIFKLKGKYLSLHDRRVLLDATGLPILSLRQKMFSLHSRWEVFRGDSSDSRNLIFSARKSSLIQFRTELNVFLAKNKSEHLYDFKVIGSWLEKSCVIFSGDSTIIGQMHRKHTVESVALGKDTFSVTVNPGIDYAFVVALVAILNEIHESGHD